MSDSAPNYGDLPTELTEWERSRAVVIPVPFEKSTTYQLGTRHGPKAIIEASANMELYDIQLGLEPCQAGIHTLPYPTESKMDSVESMIEYLGDVTKRVVDAGKIPIVLGGEHTVTLGPTQYLSNKYPSLTVLSLDAHSDLRDEYQGSRFNHACVMRRVLERSRVVEAGVRSMAIEERPIIKEHDVPIFTAEEVLNENSFIDKLLQKLTEDVYVSIDVDVLDTGLMSLTGTPEPGGLGWYDLLKILHAVSKQRNVVGFDVVELSPRSHDVGPDFLSAKLIYKFLGYILF